MDNPDFPQTGLVRLSQLFAPLGPIPASKSTWWQDVNDDRFPKPQKLGPGTTVWKDAEDQSGAPLPPEGFVQNIGGGSLSDLYDKSEKTALRLVTLLIAALLQSSFFPDY